MIRRDFLASAAGAAAWLAGCAPSPRRVVRPDAAPRDTRPSNLRLGPALAGDPLVYVGTYTEGGRTEGIFAFRMDPQTGAWRPLGATAVGPNPSFLAAHPSRGVLYAVNEVTQYEGAASGAVRAFAVDAATGALAPLGLPRATGGGAPCYVSVDRAGRYALVANYVGGSVALFPLAPDGAPGARTRLDQHAGSGPRRDRQEGPHAHSILPDPSDRFALSADLGTDQVYAYRLGGDGGNAADPLAPAATPSVVVRPGAGPRHLAFHPAGRFVYVVGELDLTANAYRFDPATGGLAALQTVPLVEGTAAGGRTAADVHLAPSGRFLYASVRGEDVIVVFAVDQSTGALTLVQRVPTGGHWPRNFALDPSGRFLYAANQRSNSIVGFRVDPADGRLTPTGMRVDVPAPVCIRFVGPAA